MLLSIALVTNKRQQGFENLEGLHL